MHSRSLAILALALLPAVATAAGPRAIVKFADGSDVRVSRGRFIGTDGDIDRLNDILDARHATAKRLFLRPADAIDRERAAASPDLNLFYGVTFTDAASMQESLDTIATMRVIEYAEAEPQPAPPPAVDLYPPSPFLDFRQTYRASAPLGVGINDVETQPGGRGENVRIADVEFGWITDHEDLDAPQSIDGFPDAEWMDHGAAVTGVLRAAENEYGMTGLAPQCELALVSVYADSSMTYNLPNAINVAAARLRPGDVLLIEQQLACFDGYCPPEWNRATSAAIRNATARGVVVIEAAGNGGFNLDESRFADKFGSDSGAIVVGAGRASALHDAVPLSNFGSRVDLQGFGENVATLGFGDAFNPLPDPRQRYTASFSGTSSAAAIVAGAAAVVQSVRKAHALPPLTSQQMRQLLIDTGTPQQGGGHIGPLPNVAAAAAATTAPPRLHRRATSGT